MTSAIRGGTATLLVKISVLADVLAFGDDPPPEIDTIDYEVQAGRLINDTDALVSLIDDRAAAARAGLEKGGKLSPEIDRALQPFTEVEIDLLWEDSDEDIDPAPYIVALEQLVILKEAASAAASGGGSAPVAPTGTVVDRQIEVALDGFDASRFLIGAGSDTATPSGGAPSGGAAGAPAGAGGATPTAAAEPVTTGPPPLALVGIGSVLALLVGTPLGLVAVRRRRSGPPVASAELVEVSKRLTSARDLAELRSATADELRRLVGASSARFVSVGADGMIEEIADWEVADGSGASSPAFPGEAELVRKAVADAVALGATVRRTAATGDRGSGGSGGPGPSGEGSAAVLATPVTLDDLLVGVLVAVRAPTPQFSEHDSDVVEQLASIMVSALHTVGRLSSLESLAQADPLTGVGNRRAFDRDVAAALAHSAEAAVPVCLLMIDVDHFKSVNDRFGHSVGDAVLQAVARELSESLRGADQAYRYGGEEFCVLLHGESATIHDASRIAERLRMSIEAHDYSDIVADGSLQTTASFGLAVTVGGTPEALQRRADEAVYAAKRSGRNRLVVAGEAS